jgi:hypothetical protein
MDCIAKSLI